MSFMLCTLRNIAHGRELALLHAKQICSNSPSWKFPKEVNIKEQNWTSSSRMNISSNNRMKMKQDNLRLNIEIACYSRIMQLEIWKRTSVSFSQTASFYRWRNESIEILLDTVTQWIHGHWWLKPMSFGSEDSARLTTAQIWPVTPARVQWEEGIRIVLYSKYTDIYKVGFLLLSIFPSIRVFSNEESFFSKN